MTRRCSTVWIILLTAWATASGQITVHSLFTDHAVLQRGEPLPVWGTAPDGALVTVALAGHRATTVSRDGKWQVVLPALPAGGPHTLTVDGGTTVRRADIWIGDVWLCAGQSNMAFRLAADAAYGAEQPVADLPQIRMFTVPDARSHVPRSELAGGQWVVCAPGTVAHYSAVSYYFAKDLQQRLHVPVGIIHSSVGGTWAQAWMSLQALDSNPATADQAAVARSRQTDHAAALDAYAAMAASYEGDLAAWRVAGGEAHEQAVADWEFETAFDAEPATPRPAIAQARPVRPAKPELAPNNASVLYNAMIHPLAPYPIQGVAFYQGESNRSTAAIYQSVLAALIADWRALWGRELPFLFVQVAPYHTLVPELREAQLHTWLTVPRTAMVVTTDVGDAGDIHPTNKRPVGQRLALAARALAYGEAVEYSGPVYDRLTVDGARAVVHFQHVGGGLRCPDPELKGFTLSGADGVFYAARADIEGDTVVVSHPAVATPVAVRYGWATVPDVNLWNAAGLPASPFRSDGPRVVPAPLTALPNRSPWVAPPAAVAGTGEPMSDADVQAQNKYGDKISEAQYARWHAYVMTRPPAEQQWLRTLEDQLGPFYGPNYIQDILSGSPNLAPDKDAWAYVPPNPQLPRLLVLGDSISRSYTAPLRVQLRDRANVHRAPANCTRTDRFFEHGETWLHQNGSNRWDYITVNYGIHDHGKTPAVFVANLRRIIARLQQTGATIFWVRTTPWSNREDSKELDLSHELNRVADALAAELGLTVIDLHTPLAEARDRLQFADNCHFNDEGAALMASILAAALDPHL
jgi:sialate O-acetylesterase